MTVSGSELVAATFHYIHGWCFESSALRDGFLEEGVSQLVSCVGAKAPAHILHLRLFLEVPGFSMHLPKTYSVWGDAARVFVCEYSVFPETDEGAFWRASVTAEIQSAARA